MRGIWSARECYCAVRVTVRRRWYDIVMLSSCALSEGVPGVRFFTLRQSGADFPPAAQKNPPDVSRSMHSALNSVLGMAVASLR